MHSNLEPKALTLWKSQDHIGATKVGLATTIPSRYKNVNHFTDTFLNIAYALYSASEASLFNDFKQIFSKYMTIVGAKNHEPPNGYHNHAVVMQHNLRATIYQFYENACTIDDIKHAETLLIKFTALAPNPGSFDEFNKKLLQMAQLIYTGKHAYFVVSFKLPFALPIPDGSYEIKTDGGTSSVSVEGFSVNDVSSRLADRHFSKLDITIKGFTCTDNYWTGPSIQSDHREPRNNQLALSAVNRIILETKMMDETIRLVLASQRDIGQVTTTQYDGAGNIFHLSIGLTFGGLSLVDVLSKQQITEKQIQLLSNRLSNDSMAMHENLYAQSLIQRDVENSVGAFYLLNSATEAMIDHALFSLIENPGHSNKLQDFLQGESICTTCDLFKTSTTTKTPPRSANPPSPFQRIKFLQEVGITNSAEVRRLQKLLSIIRNDTMRNDLSHGRRGDIPLSMVNKAITAFQDLRNGFLSLDTPHTNEPQSSKTK